MKMTLEYPEALPDLLQESAKEFEEEARFALAAKLYEMKRIPSGFAATIADMGRVDFLLRLNKLGVSAINMEQEELKGDIENVKKR